MTLLQDDRQRALLQINTAGSVDNGKSTLIGRLLFDSGGLALDVIEKIAAKTAKNGQAGTLNLALFTDGLREEQARGITIDVARHYLAREKADLIIADTPGHQEFTRNMVTGTSGSTATLILVDATKGIVEQNKRHAYIASMLGVPHITVLINKMDLVGFSQDKFDALTREFDALLSQVRAKRPNYIPISALHGDNVVERSTRMRWYDGNSVLGHLENLDLSAREKVEALRFVVQWIDRGSANNERREVVGSLASGAISAGDTVAILPSQYSAQVESIHALDTPLARASFPRTARVLLSGKPPVKRGDVLAHPETAPAVGNSLTAKLCWMDEKPLRLGTEYLLKAGSNTTEAVVESIHHHVDIATYKAEESRGHLALNDIAEVSISTRDPHVWDTFVQNRAGGRFILIDPESKTTAGAGIVESVR